MATDIAYVRNAEAPKLAAPSNIVGVWPTLRERFFSSIFNSVISVVLGVLLAWVIWNLIDWAILRAVWSSPDRELCNQPDAGACWPFVGAKLGQWIYGFYPITQRWRPNIVFILGAVSIAALLTPRIPYKGWTALFFFVDLPGPHLHHTDRWMVWIGICRDGELGWIAGHAASVCDGHRCFPAAGHLAGSGAPIGNAHYPHLVDGVYRGGSRRAADHRAVHGQRDVSAVHAAWCQFRQALASACWCVIVRIRLYGRSGTWRIAGHSQGAIRSCRCAWACPTGSSWA